MSKLIHIASVVRVVLVLLLCAVPLLVRAGPDRAAGPSQPAGLMWNRTGLPAVFPLQVKTPAGQDYFLTLIDHDTDEAALAAYIDGGAFFKVLVPPGVFRLQFAVGEVWQDEKNLFGPGADTQVFELSKPLTFEIRGLGRKAGHLVNLLAHKPGQAAQTAVKDQLICQYARLAFPARVPPALADGLTQRAARRGYVKAPDGRLSYLNEDLFNQIDPQKPPDYDIPARRYILWSQYCG